MHRLFLNCIITFGIITILFGTTSSQTTNDADNSLLRRECNVATQPDQITANAPNVQPDELILEIGLTPGSPGTNHYNYRIFADGRVVLPGLNYHVPSYRLTQNQLVTIQNELCMIDIESYSKQIEPAPFVHNGQSRIVGVKFNGGFYRLIYSTGGQAMPQQVDSFIQFVLKTIAKAPPIER
ncbi:MAG: hypothetical protein KF685_13275 [Acidobacteria bacterium]|nr:hypothetical protein [Acidobacteriota bacterium]